MDQKEMMERLKRDPAALQAVMQSQDGQMLLRLLSGSDGGGLCSRRSAKLRREMPRP